MSDNILGKDHLDYVKEQILTRQEILGKLNKDSKDIVWENGRTSWIKLISSVNIEDQDVVRYNKEEKRNEIVSNNGIEFRTQYLNLPDYSGNQLSKELILHGGTSNGSELRFGVTEESTPLPSNMANYGFADTEFGPNPMPGIVSFDSKTYDNGTLRKANIGIKAHNREQFEYIDSIYLRLGYTMLLEWGNTMYPKKSTNEEGVISTEYSSTLDIASLSLQEEFLLSNGKNPNYFYTEIEKRRELSKGNYDGFLGQVVNFSWDFDKNGTYNINLELISLGSVIDSLKINPKLETVEYLPNIEYTDPTGKERPSALETAIDVLATPTEELETYTTVNSSVGYTTSYDIEKLAPIKTLLTLEEQASLGVPNSVLENDGQSRAIACAAYFGEQNPTARYYLRLGTLLTWINKTLLIYGPDDEPAYVEIDTDENTYCYSNGYGFSGNPNKMINRLDITLDRESIKVFSTSGNYIEKFHDKLNDGTLVGRVMNLYLERDYLKGLVREHTDGLKGLPLRKFLQEILDDVSLLLGSVNTLKLRVTEKRTDFTDGTYRLRNVLQIYDETPFKKIDTQPTFNVFGVRENEGSFVTDFKLNTTIDKDFVTTLSIGAQAGGRTAGEDAMLFSKWNVGLVDRIIPNKYDIDQLGQAVAKDRANFIKLKNKYLLYLKKIGNFKSGPTTSVTNSKTIYGYRFLDVYLENAGKDKPSFLEFENVQRQFFKLALSFDAENKDIPSPFIGFLPVKLNLTMDGLSGIRIFEKLKIDSRYLPKNYGDTLEFIITELDHRFENNKWVTELGTTSIPKLFDEVVELPSEQVISKVLSEDENRIYENSSTFPSYFYIKKEVVIGMRKGTTGKRIEINELLTYLNDSPYVQEKFGKFFTELLDTYPFGYQFTINSVVRKLDSVSGVGLNSEHIWGFAIDMSVREAKPDGGFSQHILYGLGAPFTSDPKVKSINSEHRKEEFIRWNEFGIPSIAQSVGLRWGGNFRGSYDYDNVHFGAFPNWGSYNSKPKDLLFSTYPRLKTLIESSLDGSEPNAKNVISGLDLTNFIAVKEVNGTLEFSIDLTKDKTLGIINGIRFMRANGGQIITPNLIE